MDDKFFDARESENLLQSADSISKGLFRSFRENTDSASIREIGLINRKDVYFPIQSISAILATIIEAINMMNKIISECLYV